MVSISKGNTKMGAIKSVSLPPIVTCNECGCSRKCYAAKLARIRPKVREAYQNNLKILNEDPDTYWREVEGSVMCCKYFRFHVSGDIPNSKYFRKMVEVAGRNPHCEILVFTKKFIIVNKFVGQYGLEAIPSNLHVVFSGWPGYRMDNPYSFPEAHVRFRNGITTASPNAIPCSGNCTHCVQTDRGCWTMKHGEQVVFKEH